MNPARLGGLRLLADENFDPDAIEHLRTLGFDVVTARELGLKGRPDVEILSIARSQQRVILTHDADFGTLAIFRSEPVPGIVYIRPGHLRSEVTIDTLNTILASGPVVEPPFILVAHRKSDSISIRYRKLSTPG